MKRKCELSLCRCLLSISILVIYAGLLPSQVYASVYDDSTAWWHFDYDANSNDQADLDEIRDQHDWGEAALKGDTGKHATQRLGGLNWTNSAVICPAGGQNYGNMSMYFNPAVDPATSNCFPATFKANIGLAGSATIVTRLYWKGIATEDLGAQVGWLYNNRLEWNAYRGWLFGIRGGTSPSLSVYAQRGESKMDVAMTTNAWYDVAVVITDGGTNTPTDTIEFYLWKEGGALKYVKRNTTVITNSISAGDSIIGSESAASNYSSGNARKAFAGSVNHMAIWNRALSSDEINEAFGNPRPLFQIGIKNSSSYDLRVESEADAEYWPGDPWHTMRRALTGGNTDATIKLELNALQSALDYAFHLRTDSTGGGQSADLEFIVNNNSYPAKAAGPDQDYLWHIPQSLLIAGTNTFTVHYVSGPATYITFDWMELSGGWQIGYNNYSPSEFITEGSAPDDFYVTNPNFMHLERAVTAGDSEIDIHFMLSAEMAARYSYTYTTRVVSQGGNGNHALSIGFNDTVVQSYPEGLPNNTLISVPIPPELLQSGDNTINIIYDDEDGTSYSQFDFHRLELKQHGTLILIH